jgi:hypothetical protein
MSRHFKRFLVTGGAGYLVAREACFRALLLEPAQEQAEVVSRGGELPNDRTFHSRNKIETLNDNRNVPDAKLPSAGSSDSLLREVTASFI